jgi:hypothetical protein
MRARVLGSLLLVALAVFAAPLAPFAFVARFAPPLAAQSHTPEDLLVGTWVLDVPASRYLPGPAPRAETRMYTREKDGINGVVKRTHADGRVETIEYLANTDREQMVTGTEDYDAVKLRQIDPWTSEALLTHGGATYGIATRTIARNGQSMTIRFRKPDADVLNVAVYRKK